MKAGRHPIRGFFAGLLLGLGIALLLFAFGALPMSALWLMVLALGVALLGVLLAYVTPARARRASP